MRIISKWKDYYDGGAAYGIDIERIYVRTKSLITDFISPTELNEGLEFLGFCGEIFLLRNYSLKIFQDWDRHPKTNILWEQDAIDYKLKEDFDGILKKEKVYNWRKKSLLDYKTAVKNLNLFLKYKTPIFYYGINVDEPYNPSGLIINPKLSNLNFQKFYGTIEAFQKIEQFISNELVSEFQPNLPVGGNEVLGRSKGFNEYSFRHPNTKKKPKKF